MHYYCTYTKENIWVYDNDTIRIRLTMLGTNIEISPREKKSETALDYFHKMKDLENVSCGYLFQVARYVAL